MTDKEAMAMALDALEDTHYRIISAGLLDQDLLNRNFTVATALRERLAQPEQEPVAYVETKEVHGQMCCFIYRTDSTKLLPDGEKLYTTPPQRTEQEPLTHDLSHINRLTHTKTKGITEQHKYNITGFVLTNDDGKKCISDMAAVRWFENEDFFAMMHSTSPAQPAQRTEPILSLQCAHCQVTIETLNDKVMQLMAQRTWVGLTDEDINSVRYKRDWTAPWTDTTFARAIEAKLKQKNGYAEEKNT